MKDMYYFTTLPRGDHTFPFDVTDAHPGCVLFNCPVCETQGVWPKARSERTDIEIRIRDVGVLEDIEQVFTSFIVSKKFVRACQSAKLSGIEFYRPLRYLVDTNRSGADELVLRCQNEMKYRAIDITGRGGSIAQTSNLKLLKACTACGWEEWSSPQNGIFIDEQQWDGSDFFFVNEIDMILMTDQAVRILNNAKLSNFGTQPAEDYRPWSAGQ